MISAGYVQIIQLFPGGGGGYIVANRLLHPTAGVISGCALVVDYVLTIAVSVASGVDALLSFTSHADMPHKTIIGVVVIGLLVMLNLRGVKESVKVLLPIFLLFLATHVVVLAGGIFGRASALADTAHAAAAGFHAGLAAPGFGLGAMVLLFLHADTRLPKGFRDLVLDSLDLAFGLDSWMNMREQLRLSPVHASRTWRFTAEAIVLQALTVPNQPAAVA